jgi:hypothetical protein
MSSSSDSESTDLMSADAAAEVNLSSSDIKVAADSIPLPTTPPIVMTDVNVKNDSGGVDGEVVTEDSSMEEAKAVHEGAADMP